MFAFEFDHFQVHDIFTFSKSSFLFLTSLFLVRFLRKKNKKKTINNAGCDTNGEDLTESIFSR